VTVGAISEDGERWRSLQILRDSLELCCDRGCIRFHKCIVEAMVDVVLNQCAFGLGSRLLNGVKLLGDVDTRPLRLDHFYHAEKMAVGTFQPLDDIGVGCMVGVFCHKQNVSSNRDRASGPRPAENGQMKRQAISFLRFALTIALAMGFALSSDAQSRSHDLAKITAIMAEHQAEIEDHGHSHDDIVDVMHVFQSHAHEMAEYEHITSFLPPCAATSAILPTSARLAMADNAMRGRKDYGLDRPPRV